MQYTGINIILWSNITKKTPHTRQVFNFAVIQFRDFVVLKLYVSTKFRENGQESRKSRNLIPANFNTFKIVSLTERISLFIPKIDIFSLIYWNTCHFFISFITKEVFFSQLHFLKSMHWNYIQGILTVTCFLLKLDFPQGAKYTYEIFEKKGKL